MNEDFLLTVKVTPKSKESRVIGFKEKVLRLRVKAAPEKGAANEEVILLLADYFQVKRQDVVLLKGETSRDKKFLIKKKVSAT